ncbi:two-component sensor histidine kinase [hydrothermal vent metagenome]|uniref:histidine kinase n=1 Tax=hydrothermal vent metagenome TaxID=652676 RepID=A0A1W1CG82_9ZZZZ
MLLSALYWFLTNNGFDEKNFLIGSSAILIIAFSWGYIIANDLLAPKQKMDAKFEHLSREILHELNIPLSTIEANSKMLKRQHINDNKSLKRLDRIEAASRRLKRLYDELIYTINRELHIVEKEKFSLKKVVEERVDTLREFGRNPFDIHIVDRYIYADKIGFEQMIDNLLNNAMKYSDKESSISIMFDGDILSIKDRGIGMDETEIVKIFERYYQSDTKRHGEGIGLSLVKTYCEEMNIKISISSQKSLGTTIRLDLGEV